MQELDQQPPEITNKNSVEFRTWWVKLPMDEATAMREMLMDRLGWSSRQIWHTRIHGITALTKPEIAIISQLAGKDIFN